MSLNFLLNCIILILGCQGISAQRVFLYNLTGGTATLPTNNCHERKMPDGYVHSPGIGWHKFHTKAVTWNTARKTCIEEGGHLAIINSNSEAWVLQQVLCNQEDLIEYATLSDRAFVGVHNFYSEDEWVTILDESLVKTGYCAWSNVDGGQPDNSGGNQHCLSIFKTGGLDDVTCTNCYAFFCEIPERSSSCSTSSSP